MNTLAPIRTAQIPRRRAGFMMMIKCELNNTMANFQSISRKEFQSAIVFSLLIQTMAENVSTVLNGMQNPTK
jgi:hypothetical protein